MNERSSSTGEKPPIIGVFDSGFGGLTVLRELLRLISGAHFVYLGDTARLPYGAKSQATVARYAVEAARFLVQRGAKLLVIACNTATALAFEEIRQSVEVPVIGVIEPGARAALAACQGSEAEGNTYSRTKPNPTSSTGDPERSAAEPKDLRIASEAPRISREVLVLATAATVQSHAYRDTCARFGMHAAEKACPLLVPLVEEGWTDHPVTREVLRIYLNEALAHTHPSAVLLGCTHYPLLSAEIEQTLTKLGSEARVIDSAHATAREAQEHVARLAASFPQATEPSTFECFATDSVEKFARLGSLFLGRSIPEVHLLDLGG